MKFSPFPARPGWPSLLLCALSLPVVTACAAEAEWKKVTEKEDLVVYERQREGSTLQEYKAVGPIEGEPVLIKRVLDDIQEYPRFMPYVKEVKLISTEKDSRVTYQRLSPPMVGDRDYTVRVKFESRRTKEGLLSFCNRWQAANELGPAEKKGVTRVKITEGSWLLEPLGGGKTRATYSIFSDSGGALPPFIANAACKAAIPQLFASVRKQAKLPKYADEALAK